MSVKRQCTYCTFQRTYPNESAARNNWRQALGGHKKKGCGNAIVRTSTSTRHYASGGLGGDFSSRVQHYSSSTKKKNTEKSSSLSQKVGGTHGSSPPVLDDFHGFDDEEDVAVSDADEIRMLREQKDNRGNSSNVSDVDKPKYSYLEGDERQPVMRKSLSSSSSATNGSPTQGVCNGTFALGASSKTNLPLEDDSFPVYWPEESHPTPLDRSDASSTVPIEYILQKGREDVVDELSEASFASWLQSCQNGTETEVKEGTSFRSSDGSYVLKQHRLSAIIDSPQEAGSSCGYLPRKHKSNGGSDGGIPTLTSIEINARLEDVFLKNSMSRERADEMLQLIHDILKLYNVTNHCIPKTSRAVKNSLTRDLFGETSRDGTDDGSGDYTIQTFSLALSEVLFPPNEYPDRRNVPDLGYARGCHLDPLQLIAEDFVAYTTVDDIDLEPTNTEPDFAKRRLSAFASGTQFDDLDRFVKDRYGLDTVALPIGVNLDDTVYGSHLRRKSACPTYVWVMTAKGPLRPLLIGFSPVFTLTTAELKKRLYEGLNLTLDLTDKVVTFLRRKVRNCFIVEALATITEAQKYKGVHMRLKGDRNGSERSFMPLVVQLPLDNLQAYECIGQTFHHKGTRNCRFCLTKSEDFYPRNKSRSGTVSFGNMVCEECGLPRGVSETYALGMLLEKQLSRTVAERAGIPCHTNLQADNDDVQSVNRQYGSYAEPSDGRNKRQRGETLTAGIIKRKNLDREADSDVALNSPNNPPSPISLILADAGKMEIVTNRAKLQNISPMDNPLVRLLHMLVDAGVLKFHEAFPNDKLHTFDKAAVELAIRWPVAVIYLWPKNVKSLKTDPPSRRSPIAALDERLKTFKRWTAINPIGDTRAWLSDGISVLFSDSKTTKNALSKGAMTGGGLDAKKLGQYLFQLIIAIGTGGSIIPNERFEFDYSDDRNGKAIPFQVNPSEVLLGAMCRVFELQILCAGNSFLLSDIAYIDALLQETVVWMKMVWDLKQFLVGEYGSSPAVVKLHIYTHMPPYILSHGAPENTNTEVLERAHQDGVHRPSLRISNRGEDCLHELLRHSLVQRRVRLLNYIVNRETCNNDKNGPVKAGVSISFNSETVEDSRNPFRSLPKGFVELSWRPNCGQAPSVSHASGSAALQEDSWVIEQSSARAMKTAAEIPLHPVLYSPSTIRMSSTGRNVGSVDRLPPFSKLEGYLSTFVDNLIGKKVAEDGRQEGPTENNPKEFYKWLIGEAKKDRTVGQYRLHLAPSCTLKLATPEEMGQSDASQSALDDEDGEYDDQEIMEDQEHASSGGNDDQDDVRSVTSYSVAGSAFGGERGSKGDGYLRSSSKSKSTSSFLLHATNMAKESKVSASTYRRQFDFVEVQWTDECNELQVAPARIVGILKFVPNINAEKNTSTFKVPTKTFTLPIIWWMEYDGKRKKNERICALTSAKYVTTGGKLSQAYMQIVELPFITGPAAAYPFVEGRDAGEESLLEATRQHFWFLPYRLIRRCRSEALPFMKGPSMDLYPNLRPDLSQVRIFKKEEALALISRRDDRSTEKRFRSSCTSSYGGAAGAYLPGNQGAGRGLELLGMRDGEDGSVRKDARLQVEEKIQDYFDDGIDDGDYETDDE